MGSNAASVREAWPHEAHNFTPWLAENLDRLAAEMGIDDPELEGTEVNVGPLRADIVARIPQDGSGYGQRINGSVPTSSTWARRRNGWRQVRRLIAIHPDCPMTLLPEGTVSCMGLTHLTASASDRAGMRKARRFVTDDRPFG